MHKRDHTRQEITVEPADEIVESNDTANMPLSDKTCKREMLISSDVADNGRKVSKRNKIKK